MSSSIRSIDFHVTVATFGEGNGEEKHCIKLVHWTQLIEKKNGCMADVFGIVRQLA